ncbi:MAG: sulfatase-like hydrolase/transferase [Chitinophagaceae bacterium]
MKNILFIVILLINISFSATVLAQPDRTPKKSKKPNIIFILTDDLGYGDIGVFFQNQRKKANDKSEPWMLTPNLDQLAAQGAMLTQHYCGAPVCAPSRSSILLGKSQGHANVRDNQFDKALEDNHTMASTLRTAGYTTAAFGKWGLQGLNNKGPDWPAHPLNRGFDYFFGYMRHSDGHEHYPKEGLYRGKKQVWENKTDIADQLDKCYTADLWTARTKKWIIDFKKEQSSDKPFFIYLAYETPHAVLELPTQAYPKGGGLKGGLQWLGEPGNIINTASGKVDSWVHPDYANAAYDHDKNPSTADVPWPDVNKRYATSVRRIDSEIGDIMQLLKDLNIDKNTLVVFTSDNGPSVESYLKEEISPEFFNSFGPFDGIKRDVWEGGVRMPTIATWPSHIPPNSIVTSANASYDWLPTFTHAAGVAAPAGSDGVSLLPSLTHIGKQKNSIVYIEYSQNQSTPGFKEFDPSHRNRKRNQMQLIRFGDTVGVRYDIKSANDDFEIYNVAKDPHETKNLAVNQAMSAMQNKMKEQVLRVRRPDDNAPRPYDKEFISAVKNLKSKQGVNWKFYNGSFPWVPNISTLTSNAVGVGKHPSTGVLTKNKNGVLFFEGYLKVPAEGEYTFYLTAAKGAFLRIHDAAVSDADFGYKAGSESSGKIRLKAGLHPFRLYYTLEPEGESGLNFKWEEKNINKQDIPSGAYYHD